MATRQDTTVSVPDAIASPQAKLVYLYLAVRGEATADEICADLGLKKGTMLSIARSLRSRGYVERRDGYTVVDGASSL
ncbi:helix-turn-helix domain-containing protein [Natrialbaceae archaeon AArc-T1-2]|uniref:helix-turn-helix domain-containing protein n=1 Tax=Natrialbaceae archaeon AArc-T1-2 TaxID=3053904 RepID=UPI00255AC415|nr:helix-turn-helix domain-containing protein [Natrialbaceae archaeon AArc-T1-2]WIV67772.1 helix-turn-helix domain-containing protein [Natrialbaceae archaeon AArc-T1-2]